MTLSIHDVINARVSCGNASWWNRFGEIRIGRHMGKGFDVGARILQSSIHTYESLGVLKRYEQYAPCQFRQLHDDRSFRARIVEMAPLDRKKGQER